MAAISVPTKQRQLRGRVPVPILVPSGILMLLIGACFLAPWLFHMPGLLDGNLAQALRPPGSAGHLLGTDAGGNDLLARCLYAGRISIEVSCGAVLLGGLVGSSLGTIGGYRGGWIDSVIMRVLDMLIAFPALVLALTISNFLGANERDVIIAISFFTLPAFARLARGSTIAIRERGFVAATEILGARPRRTVLCHVVPNLLPTLVTYGILLIPVSMIIEAGLSYLGLGVPLPEVDWGSMISSGQPYLANAPWLVLVPSGFLLVTVLALNTLGRAIRDQLES